MQYANKFQWYLSENENWQKTLQQQTSEIPKMEKVLTGVHYDDAISKEEMESGRAHFGKQLQIQQEEMKLLDSEIGKQQKRLAKECETDTDNGIEAFCTQDILRQRIRDTEKTYVELKCNLMAFLSTVL
jgi:hypothetical protein